MGSTNTRKNTYMYLIFVNFCFYSIEQLFNTKGQRKEHIRFCEF